ESVIDDSCGEIGKLCLLYCILECARDYDLRAGVLETLSDIEGDKWLVLDDKHNASLQRGCHDRTPVVLLNPAYNAVGAAWFPNWTRAVWRLFGACCWQINCRGIVVSCL